MIARSQWQCECVNGLLGPAFKPAVFKKLLFGPPGFLVVVEIAVALRAVVRFEFTVSKEDFGKSSATVVIDDDTLR